MRILLHELVITARQSVERVSFSSAVTFLHGPVSTGKSSVARLVDFAFGGDLERTPALQKEFVSSTLRADLGENRCTLERAAIDSSAVRVSWVDAQGRAWSVNAPLRPREEPIIENSVFCLSDLLFWLCGEEPIKVRKSRGDPESDMVRLSFRDVWRYCYLDQAELDSSFFRLEDPIRGRKSGDAMRFFTGLHSERMSQLEAELSSAQEEQRTKREAVKQLREFMRRFEFASEGDLFGQLEASRRALAEVTESRVELLRQRGAALHPTDALRNDLRLAGARVGQVREQIQDLDALMSQQAALRAELVTAKTRSVRAEESSKVLDGVEFATCPRCGTDIGSRASEPQSCRLCHSPTADTQALAGETLEVIRRDLNERIDQLADSLRRGAEERALLTDRLARVESRKAELDLALSDALQRYDSAFVEGIRAADAERATLVERIATLERLREIPRALDEMEVRAGSLQGQIDLLRTQLGEERGRLQRADRVVDAIAIEFKRVLIAVGFPGVSESDHVVLSPRDWRPTITHETQEWSFWEAGSGGKKTLFNVCFALALHAVARARGLPVPSVLVIDSPTKNISDVANPDLVRALYHEIYRLGSATSSQATQFLLIDSDLVEPEQEMAGFSQRRLAGELDEPRLISYYEGP